MLQHLAGGRVDLMMGRGNTGPVYPWFGQDIRNGIALAVENYALLHRLWREDVVDWEGRFRTPLTGSRRRRARSTAIPPFVWHGSIRIAGDRRAGRLLRRRLLPQQHLLAAGARPRMVALYRRRFEHYGHGPPDHAIVGLGGQVFMRPNSQDAVREFRPYFDHAPVYGGGPSLEEYMAQTPLTVGRRSRSSTGRSASANSSATTSASCSCSTTPGCRMKTVLEQMDLLGAEVVPVLRREFERLRAAGRPVGPTDARVNSSPRGTRRRARADSRGVPTPSAAAIDAPTPRADARSTSPD